MADINDMRERVVRLEEKAETLAKSYERIDGKLDNILEMVSQNSHFADVIETHDREIKELNRKVNHQSGVAAAIASVISLGAAWFGIHKE